ncbi:hypothetical protein SH2C18_12210 [Clostridium sediminicola]|uniref:methyl-accepting chemotaxis protein n=1 Tax=Clostridium sediminicola TaxID=3114879 RepID=UPI0031F2173B
MKLFNNFKKIKKSKEIKKQKKSFKLKGINNFKISTKLITSFILVAMIAGIVGIIGIINIKTIDNNDKELYDNMTVPVAQSAKIVSLFQRTRVAANELILEDQGFEVSSKFANIRKAMEAIDEESDNLENSISNDESDEERILFNEFLSAKIEFSDGLNELLVLCQQNKDDEALTLIKGNLGRKAFKVETAIEKLAAKKLEEAGEKAALNSKITKDAIFKMTIYIIIGIILAIGLGLYISRIISKPIKKLVEASDKLANGDVDVNVKSTSQDEIGILTTSFEKMIQNIKAQATVAEKISTGNLSVYIKSKSEKDVLANSMQLVVDTLKNVVEETNTLTKAAKEGNFDARGNINKFDGGYKNIVEGINGTLHTVIDKIYWYESILNSIPTPISVTDLDMNWTFINKSFEKILHSKKEDIIGKKCSMLNGTICNTENCGITRLRNNINQTMFDQNGKHLDVDASYLYNKDGEKIGHIELTRDITEEHRKKVYQNTEVERLAKNLDLLSEGNLSLNFEVAEADEYTKHDRENFVKINNYLKTAIENMSTNIGEVSHILLELSNGNLDVETTVEYKGDFAEIKTSLDNIIDSLNQVLSDINNAADQVATGSSQVSDSSIALSQGATEQASSIEQLTASIEEIASQTKQNAQNANDAKEITETAKDNVSQGNKQMYNMLESMSVINESSNNISKIIKVIDEIAFQTNILALNAAVEAARAGEHGKGFAVVAEEVRNLAVRSANAAKEITVMIEDSIKKIGDGAQIAMSTAESLHGIVEDIDKAATLVGNIAVASNEQAIGVNQVNQGINQIANVVQTTSATSEQTASASEELSSQAQMLKNQVDKFKLKEQNEILTYKGIENLNPEVLKILESMSKKSMLNENVCKEDTPNTPDKIVLSDPEFGKY